MKKIVIMFVAFSLLLALCGCNTKHITLEQSQKNFEVYHDFLKNITNQYKLDLVEKRDINIKNQDTYKDYSININSDIVIEIRIINSAWDSSKGVESFSIDYKITGNEPKNKFNLPLFVDLVNCISGKEISVDFCNEFLNAPESKYSAEKNGYKKQDDEIVSKEYALNFFEDWNISYHLTTEEEVLTFGGLT